MGKKEVNITLPEEATRPYFCKGEADFYKMVLAHIASTTPNDGDSAEMAATGIPIICHEYLSLVLSGMMPTYKLSEEMVKENASGFKEMINHMNVQMAKVGVPLYEGDKGQIEIDYEKLKKKKQGED